MGGQCSSLLLRIEVPDAQLRTFPLPAAFQIRACISSSGSLTVTFDESDFGGYLSWIETLDTPDLAARLKRLKADDLELLTQFAIEGYSQSEIARLMGCSQQNVSLKITRIRTFLKR